MNGLLVVIEGVDGSGKKTQSEILFKKLLALGHEAKLVTFPRYENESSTLAKMYLRGDFGSKPEDVSAYISSIFFAVDRYAAYKTDFGEFYQSGGIIISDRYTTSNMVHQGAKMFNENERDRYLDWLMELEYVTFGLPKPDLVCFLDIDPQTSFMLINSRNASGQSRSDIHELDKAFATKTYDNAIEMQEKLGWTRISCVEDGRLLPAEDIGNTVFSHVSEKIARWKGY
ncbi:MAG: thymidylate kinase [Eubacteriaceae bacterium]|nr:thymidylate kinase [Eubacteriaceae bacterium]